MNSVQQDEYIQTLKTQVGQYYYSALVAKQTERQNKNLEDLAKFKGQLDDEIKNYTSLIAPGEQPWKIH